METQASNARTSKAARHRRRTATARPELLPTEGGPAGARQRHGVRARFAYAFDNAIAKRPQIVLLWMGVATLVVVLLATAAITLLRVTGVNGLDEEETFLEAFWQTLLRILDTGTVANDLGWPARLIGILVTLAGIFLAGSLIGLIANLLDQKIAELRKGHSVALERNHTLILGWSPRVPTIVSELLAANANQHHGAIVIVADEDKTRMEDTLRRHAPDQGRTTVVCRTAEPWTEEALRLGNVGAARSIIVTEAGSDAVTVKALLALHANHPELATPVVAEVDDSTLAQSLGELLGPHVTPLCSDDVVAELTAQACRQRGLGAVFAELLDFAGHEIYFAEPDRPGLSYRDYVARMSNAAVIGFAGADGRPVLNPAPEAVLPVGGRLVVVAEDDEAWRFDAAAGTVIAATSSDPGTQPPTRLAIVGWSKLGPVVLQQMDEFLDPGTPIEVVVDPTLVDPAALALPPNLRCAVTVTPLEGRPDRIAHHVHAGGYDQAIVLGYRHTLTTDEADARTLLTVLALKEHADDSALQRTVVELLDQRHVVLAEATGADDFVVSDQLTSQMLAQLSQTPELREVFAVLFTSVGASLRLRKPEWLGRAGQATFGDICATALARGETAVGVVDRITGAVTLAPAKDAVLPLGPDDRLIVLA